jgi:nucleoside-diphosphate kinase
MTTLKYDVTSNFPAHKQQTFVIIKPDGVQRSLVGDIIQRFERAGLKIVAMKMEVPTVEKLTKHYGKSDQWCTEKGQSIYNKIVESGGTPEKSPIEYGRGIVTSLLEYMSASPVVMMVLEGNESVTVVRKLVGSTEPKTSDVGTIRGDYSTDSYNIANNDNRAVRNLIHCTELPSEADGEINIWFDQSEIINYIHINEAILYSTPLKGILN